MMMMMAGAYLVMMMMMKMTGAYLVMMTHDDWSAV